MRRQVALWLADDVLTLECDEETLAQYGVQYAPDGHHRRDVRAPRLFATRHRSAQLPLWVPADAEWRKAVRLPPYVRRRTPSTASLAHQWPLPLDETAAASAD